MLDVEKIEKTNHVIKLVNFEVRHFSLTFTWTQEFAKLLQSYKTIFEGTIIAVRKLTPCLFSLLPGFVGVISCRACGRSKLDSLLLSRTSETLWIFNRFERIYVCARSIWVKFSMQWNPILLCLSKRFLFKFDVTEKKSLVISVLSYVCSFVFFAPRNQYVGNSNVWTGVVSGK